MNINTVIDSTTGDLLELRQLMKTTEDKLCIYKEFNKLARLAQGSKKRTIKITNTIHFISPNQKPTNKKSTYARIFVRYWTQEEYPYWVRITFGGDKIHYADETFTPNADITTAKFLFNSVISTEFAKFLGLNIKDFYLNTKMDEYEYMWLPQWISFQDCIDENQI